METLHNSWLKAFREASEFENVAALIINTKLEKLGLKLTEQQNIHLKEVLRTRAYTSLQIEFDDTVLKDADVTMEQVKAAFNLDTELSNKVLKALVEARDEVFREMQISLTEKLYSSRKDEASERLEEAQTYANSITEEIAHFWKRSLDSLELLNLSSLDIHVEFCDYYQPTLKGEDDFQFEALKRLHARACQTVLEIITLLRNGFADGADARWRTLHEIEVIMIFIHQYGQDVAERYLLHEHITNYKDLRVFQEHHSKLGYESVSQDEENHLRKMYDHLLNRFGKNYRDSYGWAADTLKQKAPVTFADIEKHVAQDHLRPFYKTANLNIHAGAKGDIFRLGLPNHVQDTILIGPSSFGLGSTGRQTAYSLAASTIELLTLRPNLDSIATVEAILKLRNEAFNLFDEDEFKRNHDG